MKLLVRTSFWLVILFTLISIVLDIQVWSMVFYKGVPGSAHQTLTSQIGRFLRTALMLAFIPAILHSQAKRQARLLVLALFLAVIADFFLILRQQLIVGIAIFGLMQIILIIRHLAGFQLRFLSQKPYRTGVFIGVVTWLIAASLLWSGLQASGLLIPVLVYGFLLIVSVWAAFASMHLEVLSLKPAKLAFWAMVFFLLCDITVGLGAIWAGQPRALLIRAITGFFYTPCLLLLAYSGMPKLIAAKTKMANAY